MTMASVPVRTTPIVERPAADKALGGEPIGRSISASLSSSHGRRLDYGLVFFWTIPTFGLFVSSFRPDLQLKTSGRWPSFTHP